MKGTLIVVSGPSGVGKGSLCSYVIEKTGAVFSVSATTRPPREGEVDGVNYYFLTEEEFQKNIDENNFVEYVRNYGKSYGTLKCEVDNKLEAGYDLLFDIDAYGGKAIKALYPEAVLVFIIPTRLRVLEERLNKRGSETEETKAVRLANAIREIEGITAYDYCLVNDDLSQARQDLLDIIEDKRTGSEKAKYLKLSGTMAEELVKKFKEEKNALSGN